MAKALDAPYEAGRRGKSCSSPAFLAGITPSTFSSDGLPSCSLPTRFRS